MGKVTTLRNGKTHQWSIWYSLPPSLKRYHDIVLMAARDGALKPPRRWKDGPRFCETIKFHINVDKLLVVHVYKNLSDDELVANVYRCENTEELVYLLFTMINNTDFGSLHIKTQLANFILKKAKEDPTFVQKVPKSVIYDLDLSLELGL